MSPLTAVGRYDRAIVVALLIVVILVSWAYLLFGVEMPGAEMMPMPGMPDMMMPMGPPEWTASYVALMLVMWIVMMTAMMLTSAAPMLLFYDRIARQRAAGSTAIGPTSLFALGYLVVWLAFSVVAVGLQFAFDRASLLSPMMETTSAALAGVILVAAGVYQWTPLKQACLRNCRSPLDFVMTRWQGGPSGAFRMGLVHGTYCLGCCWVLMLLLFVGGVMNFAWIAAIALFVLVEKLAPAGHWIGKAAGLALAAWGAAVLASLAPF
jgi:predicted metal-binding membrane protein